MASKDSDLLMYANTTAVNCCLIDQSAVEPVEEPENSWDYQG